MTMTLFQVLVTLGELFLLVTAYQITTRAEILQVIRAYRLQSFVLTVAAVLIAILDPETGGSRRLEALATSGTLGAIALIAALPLALALFIPWIQARATVYEPEKGRLFWQLTTEEKRLAQSIWLEQRHPIPGRTGFVFLLLVLAAFAIVFLGIDIEIDEKIGISVSLALHLAGLYNTISRKDILSQVIGVLTMDQGLYLAIVKIVNIPVPATLFVIALYFYTIITIVILFLVIPQLRHATGTINLDEIVEKSDLRG